MKLAEILDILFTARLPALTKDQLLALAASDAGKAFGDDLRAFAAGDRTRHDDLAAVAFSLAPAVKTTLEKLGYQFQIETLIKIAKVEKDRFFAALDAIQSETGSARRTAAISYLSNSGLQRVAGQPAASKNDAPAPYYSFKVYGSAAALCISEARTRSNNQHTIQIEGAGLIVSAVQKTFDWQNKIIVQLTVQEAYQVLALFENKLRSIKFDGHGARHDKSLQIEYQESHYFIRLIQKGKPALALPVRAVDALPIVSLLYKQLLRNDPHLGIADVRGMVDRMVAMM